MSSNEQQPQEYVSPFTKESVLAMTDVLRSAIKEYKDQQEGKLDFFVIIAGLSQIMYEVSYSTLPRTDEEKELSKKQAEIVSNGFLAKLDGIHAEFKTRAFADFMGAAQLPGLLAEIYCQRRDNAVREALAQKQNSDTAATPPGDSPS